MFLKRIQIEPTNRSNCRCLMCRRTYWNRNTGDMSLENYKCILAKLPDTKRIHLQGQGEPLLNSDLLKMVILAKKQSMEVATNTNGSLFTRDTATAFLDAGINRLNFSIDTLDPDLFSRTRPGPPLDLILRKIEMIAGERDKGNFTDTSLAIAVVAKQSTIKDLPSIVGYAGDLGLDMVYVQNLNYDFRPYKTISESNIPGTELKEYKFYGELAQKVADEKDVQLLLPLLKNFDKSIKCGWPTKGCYITWDGYVSLCCLQPDPDVLNFGNILENDFETIWSKPEHTSYQQSIMKGRSGTICSSCPALYGNMWHESIAL